MPYKILKRCGILYVALTSCIGKGSPTEQAKDIQRLADLNCYYRLQRGGVISSKAASVQRHICILRQHLKRVPQSRGNLNASLVINKPANNHAAINGDDSSASQKDIEALQLSLMPSIHGRIKHSYGDEDAKKLSQGIVVYVEKHSPVCSPIEGDVVYSGALKGYDHIVMIEKDANNIILLAGLTELRVSQNKKVSKGSLVGYVKADKWIYLEARHHGKPVDPVKLLVDKRSN